MNTKPLLLLCISLASFIISSCQQHTKTVTLDADNGLPFKEEFSGPSKSTYSSAKLDLSTGLWYLADALIGNSKADAAEEGAAVRIRNNGKLGMQFDVDGAQKVYVGYASYAGDQPSGWQLWVSTNGGNSYKQVGSTINADNRTVQKVA